MIKIKYKAYIKEHNKIVDVVDLTFLKDKDGEDWISVVVEHEENIFSEYDLELVKLLPYSNLDDENKRELYLGDVILFNEDEYGKIEIDENGGFYVKCADCLSPINSFKRDMVKFNYLPKYIGNIYTEPKLEKKIR
ncbi:MAG: YopX family protein [Campylobacteraceae bacterium]|nr:YopX family protein [Campylobacteraceae bacterium]